MAAKPAVYLESLFKYFEDNDLLNPILTSFITRTFGLLISRKPWDVSIRHRICHFHMTNGSLLQFSIDLSSHSKLTSFVAINM